MSEGPTCPKCKRVNRPGVKFCALCGTALSAATPSPSGTLQTPLAPPQAPPRPTPGAQPVAPSRFALKPLHIAIIAAAVIGVLLCGALLFLLGSSFGLIPASPTNAANLPASPTALIDLATGTPIPPYTPIPDTATPIVMIVTVVVTAISIDTPIPIIPTLTTEPTGAPTPLPSATTQPSPPPTRIQQPTQPPPPPTNTPPDTMLVPGMAWNQDGMVMIVPSSNFVSQCPNVALEFPVELRNTTNQSLVVTFSTADLKLEDNRQTPYTMDFRLGLPNPDCAGYAAALEKGALSPNDAYLFTVRGLGKISPEATEMVFTVNRAGRIQNARWKFKIPR